MSECQSIEQYTCPEFPSYEVETGGTSDSDVRHRVNHSLVVDLGFKIINSIVTNREFYVRLQKDERMTNHWINEVPCEGLSTPPCLSVCRTIDSELNMMFQEDVTIAKEEILYLDMAKEIVFYKQTSETLSINQKSTRATSFRGKWGNTSHGLVQINGAKIYGTERFLLIFDGVEIVLNEILYEKEPQWEMGKISIPIVNGTYTPSGCDAYPPVQQNIIYPNPASKSMPLDNDVMCQGFYDYGNPSPTEINPLIELDGGNKDYFYPSWIRGMLYDPIYEKLAADRYEVSWLKREPAGTYPTSLPEVLHDPIPKGNAVLDHQLGKMYSFAFQDRDGVARSVSSLNGEAPEIKIIPLGVTGYTDEWLFAPVSII